MISHADPELATEVKQNANTDDSPLAPQYLSLIEEAFSGRKQALARLVSLFENKSEEAAKNRHAILQHLQEDHRVNDLGFVLGITGTPGAGKSTLINHLCRKLLSQNKSLSIAVIAIDPSSHLSGGALLGDRVRLTECEDSERLFFRSQSSNLELGGITFNSFNACRLLRHFFHVVIIETVGVGQNELDVHLLADHSLLVLQPLSGDQVQFIKAGIMEIPDAFVVNKCDEKVLADQSYHLLRSSFKTSIQTDSERASYHKPIFLTSDQIPNSIIPLSDHIDEIIKTTPRKPAREIDTVFLQRWVRQAFGEFGVRQLQTMAPSLLLNNHTFEAMQRSVLAEIESKFSSMTT